MTILPVHGSPHPSLRLKSIVIAIALTTGNASAPLLALPTTYLKEAR